MLDTVLRTKLFAPPIRPNLVPRPRLIEGLNEGLQLKHGLTLISAPAGFGKTTLVSEWLANCQRPAAWLSLDEGDNDPTRFLVYIVAALQSIGQNIGEGTLAALQSSQRSPSESILTILLNEITTVPNSFLLVLDDYHIIDAYAIDNTLTFMLEHLPPQMHLVIATREDPQLPLARFRVRGQMTELRANDLRFTPKEAAEFLNQVMGLNLSGEEVDSLENRTEGWIAGLQLAALSMQGRRDVPAFIRAFAGDNRYVVDYLVEEVLLRQSDHVRSFLLQTSILNQLSGPLCDAVHFGYTEDSNHADGGTRLEDAISTGKGDGQAMLEALERGNLFVIPLDDKRHWYRYHHLFAEVLQTHLMEEQPELVPILHRRASEWYEQNDLPAGAIRHALVTGDFTRAADLAELAWPAWSGSFQSIAWHGWVKQLPDDLVRTRPVLCVAFAWAFLNAGMLEEAEARLADAELLLEPIARTSDHLELDATKMVVVDEAQFRSLPTSLATARAYHAQAIGDFPGTVKYSQQVLERLPAEDHHGFGTAAALLGLAYWATGDIEAAHQTLSHGLDRMHGAGNNFEVIVGTFVLADLKLTLGRLHEALSACEHALRLAKEHGDPMPLGTEDVYTAISGLHREQGYLAAAAEGLVVSKKLGEQVELPDWQYRWCIAQARLKQTMGDLESSLYLLDEAERLYVRTPLPDVRPIAALRARIWVAQGRVTEALGWVRERGLSVDDGLTFLHEFEHITLAKVLIFHYLSDHDEHAIQEALGLLQRLLQAAEGGGRKGSVIEILVLQALAFHAQGDTRAALHSLEGALNLAEPEGFVRIFVDEGPPMATLLNEASRTSATPNYIRHLQAAFGEAAGTSSDPQPLIEPLSRRELEVLKLLESDLNGPEIDQELMVSLNTMRTHTKNIYNKLGVNSRRAAVLRAEQLALL